jgi:putative hydrolase of the HAD superfamily
LSLRAVIFDYGMVLTGQPSTEAHDAMLRITGLPHDRFEAIYWADRHAYDEGKLTGLQFWQKITRDAQLNLDAAAIDELNLWDARMWTTQNPAMLAWQLQLKQHGIRTAILSNMGDSVLANIEREFDWLPRFDVLVWSFQPNIDAARALGFLAIQFSTVDKLRDDLVAAGLDKELPLPELATA